MSIASAKLTTMDLVDLPSNIKTPKYLADKAVALGDEFGFKITTILGEALLKHNLFCSLWGWKRQHAWVCIYYYGLYTPKNPWMVELKTVIWWAGITFDTGGISIKPSSKSGVHEKWHGWGSNCDGCHATHCSSKITNKGSRHCSKCRKCSG